MKRIAFFALAALLAAACQNELAPEKEGREPLDEPAFFAQIETPGNQKADTKVYADENMKVLWNADDRITLYNKSTVLQEYAFTGKDGDNAGGFKCVYKGDYEGTDLDAIYAVYPTFINAYYSIADGFLHVNFPARQVYREHSFGIGANAMVSVTADNSNVLRFKNLGGYLAFKLYGENLSVSRIMLVGHNDEKLSGGAFISMKAGGLPTVTMDEYYWEDSKSVILECETPVPLGSSEEDCTEFWLVLPPTDFTQGFSLTVYTSNGGVFTQNYSSDFVVERNSLMRMAALEVTSESLETPPDNEIWYTTSNVQPLSLRRSPVDGVNLVSNTYENGRGVLKFDGDVITLTNYAFSSNGYLSSIVFPSTLKRIETAALSWCGNLSSILLPEGLEYLGTDSFANCYSLCSITFPESLVEVGNAVLAGCSDLTSIQGKWASEDGRCFVMDGVLLGFAPGGLTKYTLPDGITGIRPLVFANCYNLNSITLPDSINDIPPAAFPNCYNLSAFYGKGASEDNRCLILNKTVVAFAPAGLTEYTLPEGVESIGESAFSYAYLQEIHFPSSLKTIGASAFNYQPLRNLVIPAGVTQIGGSAFYECYNLNSITVEALTPPELGNDCFYQTNNCPIYVPATSLGAYLAAEGWSAYVRRIQFISGSQPNDGILYTSTDGGTVSPYDAQAFSANILSNTYENGMGTLRFDRELTAIQANAFKGCETLSLVILPNSVTLEGDPFIHCNQLSGIWGANASEDKRLWVVNNEAQAFAPGGLNSYSIPERITALKGGFEGLTGLESLTLPSTLGSIKTLSISSLQELKVNAVTPPVVESGLQLGNLQSLIVPEESIGAYSSAAHWSNFANLIQGAVHFAIQIDGNFSDWDALDNSKVSMAQCAADARWEALKVMKVCADANYVYVYFEWDPDMIYHEPDVDHVPFHCFLNTDGNTSTGGFSDWFSDACTDVLLEGFIYPGGAEIGSYDPGAYAWSGAPNGSGWVWDDLGAENLCQGAGIEGKYELLIDRAAMAALGFPIAEVFSIGIDIEQSWDRVGLLPNATPTDDNYNGIAPSLTVYSY